MRKILGLLLSLGLLAGCASTSDVGEPSSVVQDSQTEVDQDNLPTAKDGDLEDIPPKSIEELAEEYPEEWAKQLTMIAVLLEEASIKNPYPMDFVASPSTDLKQADAVEEKVRNATKLWGDFYEAEIPLAVTVVHPNDKEWYLERWEALGRDNAGEEWFGKALGQGGGGGVGWNDYDQIPHMYFMFSDRYKPSNLKADLFAHEVTHFFQTLAYGDAFGDQAGTCWIGEGSAEFIGLAGKYSGNFASIEEDLAINLKEYSRTRQAVAEGILRHHQADETRTLAEGLSDDILLMTRTDRECGYPSGAMLGYKLGMFVTEKFMIDFDLQVLVDFFHALREQPVKGAFETATGLDYEQWVRQDLVPYLEQEFIKTP